MSLTVSRLFVRARFLKCAAVFTFGLGLNLGLPGASRAAEEYVHEPLPPGFQVVSTELEGPVFADANGKTFYSWKRDPKGVGELPMQPQCFSDDEPIRGFGGPPLMMPPEDRVACTTVWPVVVAPADAKPLGKWSIITTRKDGIHQWAYDGFAVYTSYLDEKIGDTLGGTKRIPTTGGGSPRVAVGPKSVTPSGLAMASTLYGRIIITDAGLGFPVYIYKKDAPGKSNCQDQCVVLFPPVMAGRIAISPGPDWTKIERTPGVWQWAFKGMPLYTYTREHRPRDPAGLDVPGWDVAAYVTSPGLLPPEFKIVKYGLGDIVTHDGKPVYRNNCTTQTAANIICDHPKSPQFYRIAMCAYGNVDECLRQRPYVLASKNSKSTNRTWTIVTIDPKTGRFAQPEDAGALRVWAYRGRPIYYYYEDEPGWAYGDGVGGEMYSARTGYVAIKTRELWSATEAEY